jgi:phosphoglycolate phosphatase-like HAD superfamily hydrolase
MTVQRPIFPLLAFIAATLMSAPLQAREALASWNDGPTRQAIVDFVARVTTTGGPDYVKPEERIAVFDNDGTLWTEQPAYTQLLFALDRVKALAPQHPEWRRKQPFKAALAGDVKALAAGGARPLMELMATTHAGGGPEDFQALAAEWLAHAENPKFKARYDRLVYQPMLELLDYLRANGFKTYIVSGGGVDFLRAFAERAYGVPPEQIIGSSIVTKFARVDGKPALRREAKIAFIDDKEGKPVAINAHIGRRPIAAFGNSDGDLEMLQWTTAGAGPRFGLIVHHDDAAREAAYDRASPVGRLARALDEAPQHGWVVVSMKKDWKVVFPEAPKP